jgi:plasmid stability protein
MSGLLLKDVPPELHARLKARAAANRRSLSAEALTILEDALEPKRPTLADIDALRVRGRRPLTQEIVDEARREGRP